MLGTRVHRRGEYRLSDKLFDFTKALNRTQTIHMNMAISVHGC